MGKVTKVPKLNEDKAIEEGAQLLSEIVILSIAAGLVMFEYRRSSEKEDAKQVHFIFHDLLLMLKAFKPNVVASPLHPFLLSFRRRWKKRSYSYTSG